MVAVLHRSSDFLGPRTHAMAEIMYRNRKLLLIAVLTLGSMIIRAADRRERILWVDSDMDNIPEPAVRHIAFAENVINAEFIEQGKRVLDVPRWTRFAAGHPKPALNVNALDEVPSSSWFTN